MEDPLGSGGFAYYLHLVLPSGNTILLAVNVPDPWTAPQVSACLPGQGNWLRAALRGLPKMAGGGGGKMAGGVGGAPKMAGAQDGGSEAAGMDTRPPSRAPASGQRGRTGPPALPCPFAGAEARQRRLPEAGGSGGSTQRCGFPAGRRRPGSSSPSASGGWCSAGTPQVAGAEGREAATVCGRLLEPYLSPPCS